jgi:hypothetical protein
MARQLPDDPHKRRQAVFRRLYQFMPHWREQIVAGIMTDIIVDPESGEEIFYGDLMVGLDTLPPRQREAFTLICMQGYTETAAAKIMLPNSKWSTTVQQHVNAALERMVARYDEQQSGVRQLIIKWRSAMSLHPLLESHIKDAAKEARKAIVAELEQLKAALAQVDQLLKGGELSSAAEPKAAPVELDAERK